jgi:hypothetical protein
MEETRSCINCGRDLMKKEGLWICVHCNTKDIEDSRIFIEEQADDGYVFIECPGATLYEDGTDNIIAGVKFHDDDDPTKGFRIIDRPIYAPTHTRRRRIKKEALGKIRRCQGCQDYTIRLRRREGPDFYIPSHKHPNRKKLKSVDHLTYEPR